MTPDLQDYLAMYQTTQGYLKLSSLVADYLGGIRWSTDDDLLVYPDGKAFAFFAPIAEFLEGFASGGKVIPFGCVLHWVHLLQHGRRHPVAEVRRLCDSFSASGSPWRNAGALAAVLSDTVPEVAVPPRLEHVCRRLRDRTFPIRWFTSRFNESPLGPAESPPIAPRDFERLVTDRLAAYSEDDLRGWLGTGRGPVREAGRALAREQPLPRTLTGVLAALLLRARMAGAETHVTRLVGALTLPPRRLAPQELPVGGYADMTTHGEVEHILPSQHALDDLEFLRRFAERELLFFRREEPPAQNRQEIVVLIDQGVRTWGDVRLVLAAAALALGKQSASRKMRFALAGTSSAGQLLDPLETNDETLGELIEASDLSFNPGAALEAVLEQSSGALRDIVLLTHPRNLREADVGAAARRAGARDRLFAVTLDEAGDAVVSEVRHGSPVKLRQFHVDFTPAPVPPPVPVTSPAEPLPPWTGDVEPVPFPFRFGTSGAVLKFEFDHDGRWLLTVSADGMLHLWGLDDGHREVLARPFVGGMVLRDVRSITGVQGGFVICGPTPDGMTAAHYDVVRRRCLVHRLGRGTAVLRVHYFAEIHTLRLLVAHASPRKAGVFFLDLATGECADAPAVASLPRIQQALANVDRGLESQSGALLSGATDLVLAAPPPAHCDYRLDVATGTITFRRAGHDDHIFVPLDDGKGLLRNASILAAQAAGEVLAVCVRLHDRDIRLILFRGVDGSMLREHRVEHNARFLLSNDGRWLALGREPRILVEKIDAPSQGTVTRCGGFSAEVRLFLGDRCFLLTLGKGPAHWHLVRWSGALAQFQYLHKNRNQRDENFHTLGFTEVMRKATPTDGGWTNAAWPFRYDPQRFIAAGYRDGIGFALDRFGQVAVLDESNLLLCMFMAFRDRLAAWLPDGSRCGSDALGLGPETSGAREKLAHVLKNASKGEPGTLTTGVFR